MPKTTSFGFEFVAAMSEKPVVCLLSESHHWFNRAVARFKEELLGGGETDFNYSVHFADDVNWTRLIADCNTLPFMAERRVIFVKNITTLKKKDEAHLLAYLKEPNPATFLGLHFIEMDYKKKRGSKIIQTLLRKKSVFELPAPGTAVIREWLKAEQKKLKIKLTEEGIDLFAEALEPSWDQILMEWEKVRLYAGEGDEISATELFDMLTVFRTPELEQLTDAILRHQKEKVLLLMANQPLTEKNIIPWLGLMRWHLRILIDLAEQQSESLKRQRLKAHRIFYHEKAKNMLSYAKGHSADDFAGQMNVLMEMDDTIRRRSRHLFRFYLERMILKLTIPRRKSRK